MASKVSTVLSYLQTLRPLCSMLFPSKEVDKFSVTIIAKSTVDNSVLVVLVKFRKIDLLKTGLLRA